MASSSQYLATKTAALTSQTSFSPPEHKPHKSHRKISPTHLPPEAFPTGLESLILTSDTKLNGHTHLPQQSFFIPELPPSITSLKLELFSLPPQVLRSLGHPITESKSNYAVCATLRRHDPRCAERCTNVYADADCAAGTASARCL